MVKVNCTNNNIEGSTDTKCSPLLKKKMNNLFYEH